MNRSLILAGGALAATAAVAAALWWPDAPPPPAPMATAPAAPGALTAEQIRRLGITTEAALAAGTADLGSVPGTITLPPEARVAVTAPFGGTAVRVMVVAGQAVRQGQPLAHIRSIEPVQYGAALARGEAQLAVARAEAARTDQLAREGIIARARADTARAAQREAEVVVRENRRILSQTGAGAGGDMVLRAPISGRVATVNVQTGGPVDGLTAPFVVENSARFMLDLLIPERLARDVNPGMAVEVAGTGGAAVPGTIVSVGGSIDPVTRAVLAKARIGGDPGFVSGRTVMARLKGSADTPGVSVPISAVTRLGDKDVVFVSGRQGFAVRPVTLAGRSGDRATLSAGLAAGERVATSGLAELKVILGGD